jgi:hypothetical protein
MHALSAASSCSAWAVSLYGVCLYPIPTSASFRIATVAARMSATLGVALVAGDDDDDDDEDEEEEEEEEEVGFSVAIVCPGLLAVQPARATTSTTVANLRIYSKSDNSNSQMIKLIVHLLSYISLRLDISDWMLPRITESEIRTRQRCGSRRYSTDLPGLALFAREALPMHCGGRLNHACRSAISHLSSTYPHRQWRMCPAA